LNLNADLVKTFSGKLKAAGAGDKLDNILTAVANLNESAAKANPRGKRMGGASSDRLPTREVSCFCCLLSAVCCLLSAVCCLLSAVCCLLSAVCCLPHAKRMGGA
jgi:hypothetical protein